MKNPNQEKLRFIKKITIFSIALCLCFTLLIFEYFRIQILEESFWQEKADRQHYFFIKEPFLRGRFFSNTSIQKSHINTAIPFVFDIEKYHLHIDPLSIANHANEITNNLLTLLNLSKNKEKQFLEQFQKKSRNRKLISWIDGREKEKILEWWIPFSKKLKIPQNSLFFVRDFKRSYPFGPLLGQTLHTIQEKKNEITQQAFPTGGLEYRFNSYLQGKLGKRKMLRSPRHSFDLGEIIEDPENGCDIYLTINHVLQAICEEELKKGVNKVKSKAGWAVMMDPQTGDILALAQYPFFYPEKYQEYYKNSKSIQSSRIMAATDAYEPASVMKAITVAIALLANEELTKKGEDKIFDPEEKIATFDGTFPGRSSPIKDTKKHKFLNMDMAIQKSSNIYVARVVQRIINRLGNEWYRNILMEKFGFGKKTEIELPSESPGVLPKPGRKYPNGKLEWSVPTPFSMAMGHNIQSNTFQVIRAFSVFANNGYLVQPNLVKKIVKYNANGEKEVILDRENKERIKSFPKVLPNHIVKRVKDSLKYVTKKGGGGWRADIHGYTEFCKSGTEKKIIDGKYSSEKYCASFIGATPAENSAFTLMVVIDEPDPSYLPGVGNTYYGSIAAAPIFKAIAERSLEYLGIPPDDPHGYSQNDPRTNETKADWVLKSRLLHEKYETWNK